MTDEAKYSVPDEYWEDDDPDGPPAWKEDTSARTIEFDVQLHEEGYQTDERWTIHCSDVGDDIGLIAQYAVEHRNKGNYWRDGEFPDDAVDFEDLPLRVRQRAAAVLNRDLSAITPDMRSIHREDGTGLADGDTDGSEVSDP